jgi:hypothetical protein
MKRKENPHQGCPNRNHCRKDESKCAYLISSTNKCYLETVDSEDFV